MRVVFRVFMILLLATIPRVALANEFAAGTLQYVNGSYRFTTQTHAGMHFSLDKGLSRNTSFSIVLPDTSNGDLSDLDGQDCGRLGCQDTDAVHMFFSAGRLVNLKYGEVGLDSVQIIPLGVTLASSVDHDALLAIIAKNFPLSSAAQTAPTPDGKPLYVTYDNNSGVCTERVDPNDEAAIEQSIRYQNEQSACMKIRSADPDADAKYQRYQVAQQASASAAENAREEQERKAAAAATAAQKRQEAREAADKLRVAIKALPQTHRVALNAMNKCVHNVDLNSCAIADITASDNYRSDRVIHDNRALCEDRAIMATSGYDQMVLAPGYVNQMQMFRVDQTLGEIIDNCPEQAARALDMRRKLHNQ